MPDPSLQERYFTRGICFGCGPANPRGLRIKSVVGDGEVVAEWQAESHHEAFPGVLSGGIIGTLLDCHSNWTAAHHLMVRDGSDRPPCTVTAEYHVKLQRPTPSDAPLRLAARVIESDASRVRIEATLEAGGRPCATCRGLFVAVEPGHPAYHRW